jgi:hypothetical protein
MNVPTPKFAKGDKVFYADTFMTTHRIDCPDCDGSGKWPITSPAGHPFTIPCARCAYNYGSRLEELRLSWPVFTSLVRPLTIGSIRINTDDDDVVTYMCVETGIGSGSVYRERDLYDDKVIAQKAADGKAQASNLSHKEVRTQALTVLPYVHLTYQNAVEAAHDDTVRKLGNRIRNFIYDLKNVESVEEIPALIEKFKNDEEE